MSELRDKERVIVTSGEWVVTRPRRTYLRQAALTVGVIGAAIYAGHITAGAARAPIPETIHEDEAGFDCRTHGNDVCNEEGRLVHYVPGVLDVPDSWPCAVKGEPYTCYEVTLQFNADGSVVHVPTPKVQRQECREQYDGEERDICLAGVQ